MGTQRASTVSAPIASRASFSERLFLIADDLTGALDTAAQFARAHRPIDVRWDVPAVPVSGDLVLSTGSREADAATARAAVVARLSVMGEAIPDRPFIKLDSLLRGNPADEVLAAIDHLKPDATVIAPAFPGQGRVMRGGRQYVLHGDDETLLATDLAAELRHRGQAVTLQLPGAPILPGVSLYDAARDDDLAAIVESANLLTGRILWCGSAGLAKALAGTQPDSPPLSTLPRPILGLFGTDHPVTRTQVENCAAYVLASAQVDPGLAALVRSRLRTDGVALVRPDLPEGLPRDEAAAQIATLFDDLATRLDPPATLIVSGGETLQSLCRSLMADKLVVTGEILPGIPVSRIAGGRFDGVTVISKSGAFGAPDLFQRLLEPTQDPTQDEG